MNMKKNDFLLYSEANIFTFLLKVHTHTTHTHAHTRKKNEGNRNTIINQSHVRVHMYYLRPPSFSYKNRYSLKKCIKMHKSSKKRKFKR